MPLWILNRPKERCCESEVRTAELLSRLPDDWVIRWGFHYEDNQAVVREGDFLVLGPGGGLMVLEAKSSLLFFASTGRWNTDDHDHPLHQLDAEWSGVVKTIDAAQGDRPKLHVARALALPSVEVAPQIASYCGIPRHLVIAAQELRDFVSAWQDRFHRARKLGSLSPRSRAIFFDTYGRDATPKAIRHFVDEADRILMRHTESNHDLLDTLAGNRQLMVQGGTGSGKTWLALEQAFRWSRITPKGGQILLLCYNLALADLLRELVEKAEARGRCGPGTIVVRSWEALARELVESAGLCYDVPASEAGQLKFYTKDLPELMAMIVEGRNFQPSYEAMVVDEAQDHNTAAEGFPPRWRGPGWWGIYWRLLEEGRKARLALFYDAAQRPDFRESSGFDDELIHRKLGGRPVLIRLLRTVRYSRPILEFLKSLKTPSTAPLVESLRQHDSLPEGPEVQVMEAGRGDVLKVAADIASGWLDRGFCRPDEILVLSKHGHTAKSALAGVKRLAGCELVPFLDRRPGCISQTSANKAKGLDALGVILLDFAPFGPGLTGSEQVRYFMGASRARHLLAVVHIG